MLLPCYDLVLNHPFGPRFYLIKDLALRLMLSFTLNVNITDRIEETLFIPNLIILMRCKTEKCEGVGVVM